VINTDFKTKAVKEVGRKCVDISKTHHLNAEQKLMES